MRHLKLHGLGYIYFFLIYPSRRSCLTRILIYNNTDSNPDFDQAIDQVSINAVNFLIPSDISCNLLQAHCHRNPRHGLLGCKTWDRCYGWNCIPTNQGVCLSSMISIRSPLSFFPIKLQIALGESFNVFWVKVIPASILTVDFFLPAIESGDTGPFRAFLEELDTCPISLCQTLTLSISGMKMSTGSGHCRTAQSNLPSEDRIHGVRIRWWQAACPGKQHHDWKDIPRSCHGMHVRLHAGISFQSWYYSRG